MRQKWHHAIQNLDCSTYVCTVNSSFGQLSLELSTSLSGIQKFSALHHEMVHKLEFFALALFLYVKMLGSNFPSVEFPHSSFQLVSGISQAEHVQAILFCFVEVHPYKRVQVPGCSIEA
ncbi:hypothetical protein NPIL_376351 [Nephila pilipes]|uniref:Uncharacterized protein n=1 Tax=Nephila pilipes TaxID=299642 RepID=A0A8X6UFJ5_NEPPI|nr:hypothetical protein NPIL_376351 [Nephila pilipes]